MIKNKVKKVKGSLSNYKNGRYITLEKKAFELAMKEEHEKKKNK